MNSRIAAAALGLTVLFSSSAAVAKEVVLDPTSERLRTTLGDVRELRVFSNGRSLTLERPVIGIDGISFARASGWPKRRPALFTTTDWNSAPPPNPIPWSDIDRVERRVTRVSPVGIILGAGVGYLVGRAVGPRVGFQVAMATNSIAAFWVTNIVFVIGTPVLGAMTMGTSREWERVDASSHCCDR